LASAGSYSGASAGSGCGRDPSRHGCARATRRPHSADRTRIAAAHHGRQSLDARSEEGPRPARNQARGGGAEETGDDLPGAREDGGTKRWRRNDPAGRPRGVDGMAAGCSARRRDPSRANEFLVGIATAGGGAREHGASAGGSVRGFEGADPAAIVRVLRASAAVPNGIGRSRCAVQTACERRGPRS
jgi:hypothetical protein